VTGRRAAYSGAAERENNNCGEEWRGKPEGRKSRCGHRTKGAMRDGRKDTEGGHPEEKWKGGCRRKWKKCSESSQVAKNVKSGGGGDRGNGGKNCRVF